MIVGFEGVIEHAGEAVRSDEGGDVGFLGDFGIIFVGFQEGFDIGKAARLSETLDGEVLGVARGDRGSVVVGDGGVDF